MAKVTVSCMVCGTQWEDEPPKMCCSGRECGCMGLPIEPILCSKECGEKLFKLPNSLAMGNTKNELFDINPIQTGKEIIEESNENDLKEMCHYYGGWNGLREVIDRLEDNDNEAAFERHCSRD